TERDRRHAGRAAAAEGIEHDVALLAEPGDDVPHSAFGLTPFVVSLLAAVDLGSADVVDAIALVLAFDKPEERLPEIVDLAVPNPDFLTAWHEIGTHPLVVDGPAVAEHVHDLW